jgi:hypothetical protein
MIVSARLKLDGAVTHSFFPIRLTGPDQRPLFFRKGRPEKAIASAAGNTRIGIAAVAIGNPVLAFALSAAFVGPLLKLCGAESGGIHFDGDSSTGKTTLLRAAASVGASSALHPHLEYYRRGAGRSGRALQRQSPAARRNRTVQSRGDWKRDLLAAVHTASGLDSFVATQVRKPNSGLIAMPWWKHVTWNFALGNATGRT